MPSIYLLYTHLYAHMHVLHMIVKYGKFTTGCVKYSTLTADRCDKFAQLVLPRRAMNEAFCAWSPSMVNQYPKGCPFPIG